MNGDQKPVFWLSGRVKSPPFSDKARAETGRLLRRVQRGESIGMPASRPMPGVAPRCHELRVRDVRHDWRVVYRIDDDAILVVAVFPKTTPRTPKMVVSAVRSRLDSYDQG